MSRVTFDAPTVVADGKKVAITVELLTKPEIVNYVKTMLPFFKN